MFAAELHNRSEAYSYLRGMRRKHPTSARAVLAANLRNLMDRRDWTQTALGDKSGVSQRHVSSLLNKEQDCTTEVLDDLAGAFGLPSWILLIPDLPIELLDSQSVHLLVRRYAGAGPEGQALLDRMAEREAFHNQGREKVLPFGRPKSA